MLRKMIKGGFKRRIDDNNEQTFHFIMSSEDVLRVCKTEDILQYIKRQQHNYLGHIARQKNTNITKRLLFLMTTLTGRGADRSEHLKITY